MNAIIETATTETATVRLGLFARKAAGVIPALKAIEGNAVTRTYALQDVRELAVGAGGFDATVAMIDAMIEDLAAECAELRAQSEIENYKAPVELPVDDLGLVEGVIYTEPLADFTGYSHYAHRGGRWYSRTQAPGYKGYSSTSKWRPCVPPRGRLSATTRTARLPR